MISNRLQKICELAGTGETVADIGTDHGFVPIRLIETGAFRKAIASDIGEGPLQRAKEHIAERGLAGRIDTRLGSGLCRIRPGEADTLVIAGMGGRLILDILGADLATALAAKQMILSPQSDYRDFRDGIHQMGFRILSETWLTEEGKDYVIFRILPGQDRCYSEAELSFGRAAALDAESLEVRRERLRKEEAISRELLEKIADAGSDRAAARRDALRKKLVLISDIIDQKEGNL